MQAPTIGLKNAGPKWYSEKPKRTIAIGKKVPRTIHNVQRTPKECANFFIYIFNSIESVQSVESVESIINEYC